MEYQHSSTFLQLAIWSIEQNVIGSEYFFLDNDKSTKVLNHCTPLAKYHIYIHKLKDNDNIDMYAYLAYLKQQLI